MKFKAKGGGGDFKQLPAGTHLAVCDMVVDLGLQPGNANFPEPKHKIYVRFQVPAERVKFTKDDVEHEGPQVIGAFYTASMHEKSKLRGALESWRGKSFTDEQAEDFDVASIIGKTCILNVVENFKNDRVYSNIASISPMMKGATPPQAEGNLIFYDDSFKDNFDKLPEWLRDKITSQIVDEPKPRTLEITDDDIPFS